MTKKRHAWNTTVFMKQAMAVSGLFFVFFILMHCWGNLKAIESPEAFNEYAHHLRTFLMPILPYGGLLNMFRAALVAALLVHGISAFYLWHRSRRARGSRYQVKRNVTNAYAARTMMWGGIILLVFVVFHILHFTTKTIRIGDQSAYSAGPDSHGVDQAPYLMMQTTFSHWYMLVVYGLAVLALAFHISHGIWSALQTLGWLRNNTRYLTILVSGLVGAAVFFGFMASPIYIYFLSLGY